MAVTGMGVNMRPDTMPKGDGTKKDELRNKGGNAPDFSASATDY